MHLPICTLMYGMVSKAWPWATILLGMAIILAGA